MKLKRTDLAANLLMAIAITLIVNFSYLLVLFGTTNNEWRPRIPCPNMEHPGEGVLTVSPDGHGYLVYEERDSVYVTQQRIRWFKLHEGDVLEVDVNAPRREGAKPSMNRIYKLNGEDFDYNKFFKYPTEMLEMSVQFVFYLILSFLLISLMMHSSLLQHKYTTYAVVRLVLLCTVVVVGMYLMAPVTDWYSGNIRPNFTHQRWFDATLVLKFSFTAIVSIFYGWLRLLVARQQGIEMEIEQLKNESLTARYNVLVGQISPHFFFNSLNSLSMLVREQQHEQALNYIDRLSYSFRYIIQNGQNMLVTLDEELQFAEAFSYQYGIRYADKLFFDFEIDDRYRQWQLPALSLQPLIGNAVKHNTITKNRPLRVTIRVADGWLEVSNPIAPKLESEPSTGIGLQNLQNRWRLIVGVEIEIINDGKHFTVRLPLQKNDKR